MAKKVCMIFELPSEPYYKAEDFLDLKEKEKKSKFFMSPNQMMLNSQIAAFMLKGLQ
jgi:hypothetical protein